MIELNKTPPRSPGRPSAVNKTIDALINLLFAFRAATVRKLSIRDVLPGAIVAAIGWQLLQSFGVVYVNHVVKKASDTDSVFALVLGLLAFLYLTALLVIVCAEINAVRLDKLYPRALLTPFTDDVRLTPGDISQYEQ
jgi:uncharacterized BrkB/YihY/UPF0761 family membrane protein